MSTDELGEKPPDCMAITVNLTWGRRHAHSRSESTNLAGKGEWLLSQ